MNAIFLVDLLSSSKSHCRISIGPETCYLRTQKKRPHPSLIMAMSFWKEGTRHASAQLSSPPANTRASPKHAVSAPVLTDTHDKHRQRTTPSTPGHALATCGLFPRPAGATRTRNPAIHGCFSSRPRLAQLPPELAPHDYTQLIPRRCPCRPPACSSHFFGHALIPAETAVFSHGTRWLHHCCQGTAPRFPRARQAQRLAAETAIHGLNRSINCRDLHPLGTSDQN
jgi:hypothetical protein